MHGNNKICEHDCATISNLKKNKNSYSMTYASLQTDYIIVYKFYNGFPSQEKYKIILEREKKKKT